jgi:peptide/nickel transport system permease protein
VTGTNMTDGFFNRLWHLTLPAFALAISTMAVVARVTRTSVREEQRKEHVQTAISRGIPYHYVVRRHVLRNAAIPILTVSGLTIASLIAVSAVVERAFNVVGLGSYLLQAANQGDLAVVQGISLILVFAFILANTLVDVLYALLDPRVAIGESAV